MTDIVSEAGGGARSRQPVEPGVIGANFSMWLDFMRWLAAWAVLVAHIGDNQLAYVSSIPAPERSPIHYAFAFFAGFGHPAVMAFFVISGFLVGGGYWRSWVRKRGEPFRFYITKRILRLNLVLVPALALTLVLDVMGKDLFGGVAAGIYVPPQANSDGLPALACNLAFLQTALCNEFGTDGALWSLFNEFWYYVLWPPLMAALFFPIGAAFRIGLLLAIGAVAGALTHFQFTGAPLAPYMLIWLLGVVAAARNKPLFNGPRWLAVALFLAALVGVRLVLRRGDIEGYGVFAFTRDFGLGVLFCNMLIALKQDARLTAPFGAGLHARLAGFSYSLYCTHTPVLLVCAAATTAYLGTGWRMVPQGILSWLIVSGAFALSLIVGYLFSLMTEAHTDRVRRALFTFLHWRVGGA
jgi:peptidoglycan/LPS O-acetylase OafA/YrhL